MRRFSHVGWCCLFLLWSLSALCQDIGLGEPETLWVRKRQWDVYATIHTNGVGAGFRYDYIKSIKLQHGIDVKYTYYRHFKEQRLSLSEGLTIVYGKKNYFALVRAGYGFTRILNTKHYSGGVEVGWFFYGGLSLGFSVPVYLNVYVYEKDGVLYTEQQQYDETIHNISMIKSAAPIYKGFKKMKVHPGIYAKTGLSFDFSTNDALVVKLDIGAAIDAYAIPVEKMAYANKQYLLLTGYLAIHMGKRLTNYE